MDMPNYQKLGAGLFLNTILMKPDTQELEIMSISKYMEIKPGLYIQTQGNINISKNHTVPRIVVNNQLFTHVNNSNFQVELFYKQSRKETLENLVKTYKGDKRETLVDYYKINRVFRTANQLTQPVSFLRQLSMNNRLTENDFSSMVINFVRVFVHENKMPISPDVYVSEKTNLDLNNTSEISNIVSINQYLFNMLYCITYLYFKYTLFNDLIELPYKGVSKEKEITNYLKEMTNSYEKCVNTAKNTNMDPKLIDISRRILFLMKKYTETLEEIVKISYRVTLTSISTLEFGELKKFVGETINNLMQVMAYYTEGIRIDDSIITQEYIAPLLAYNPEYRKLLSKFVKDKEKREEILKILKSELNLLSTHKRDNRGEFDDSILKYQILSFTHSALTYFLKQEDKSSIVLSGSVANVPLFIDDLNLLKLLSSTSINDLKVKEGIIVDSKFCIEPVKVNYLVSFNFKGYSHNTHKKPLLMLKYLLDLRRREIKFDSVIEEYEKTKNMISYPLNQITCIYITKVEVLNSFNQWVTLSDDEIANEYTNIDPDESKFPSFANFRVTFNVPHCCLYLTDIMNWG